MLYNPPTGSTDPNASYIGKNVALGTLGSKLPPGAAEFPQRELINLITLAGLTPTNSDLAQVTRAVRGGQLDFDATDTGTADAMQAQVGLTHTQLQAGLPFTIVKGPNSNSGTKVPTLTITDLNGNNGLTGNVVKATGAALGKGDLPGSALITMRCIAPAVFAVVSLILASDVLALIAAGKIGIPNTVIYPTPGTYTYTPSPAARALSIVMQAGGGGGGGSSGTSSSQVSMGVSGGGGTSGTKTIVGPASSYILTLGAGGTGGITLASGAAQNGGAGLGGLVIILEIF